MAADADAGDFDLDSLDRLELKTWQENKDKYSSDVKNGINNKCSKAVQQFAKDGKFIKEFSSITEACKVMNLNMSGIVLCCQQRRHHCGGYVWRYGS